MVPSEEQGIVATPPAPDGPPLPLIVFEVEGRRLALPVTATVSVLRMVAISPLSNAPGSVLGVVNVRGAIVPVFDIRRRLRLDARGPRASDRLILVRIAQRLVAVPADRAEGLREVPAGSVRPPDTLMREAGAIAGLVAITEGILLIQDPGTFFSADEERRLDAALSSRAAP